MLRIWFGLISRGKYDQDGGGCSPSRSCPIWECGSWLVGCYSSSGWLYCEAWSGSCPDFRDGLLPPKFSVFESTYRLESSSAKDAWWCATSKDPLAFSTNTAVDESAPPGPSNLGADNDPTASPSESSTCRSSARKPSRAGPLAALMGARLRIAPPKRSSHERSAASEPTTGLPPGCTHARNERNDDASRRSQLS